MTNPEDVKSKAEKDKERSRPPIEMSLSQIAPFDVLPYVKANHWSTLSLELRSNYDDYDGFLQTAPVPLIGLPIEMIYRRDARLAKTQRMRLGMQILLPQVPKPPRAEISVELLRPEAVRPNDAWPAIVHTLEPHQMLVLILSKESNSAYANWNRYQGFFPQSVDRDDVLALDKLRYYRTVLPINPDKPPLSPHPLTWTPISHVVWDGLAPETLNPSQQQAMLDWLHWGGQITLVGGAASAFSVLKDSFLGPYLPAETTGDDALLDREALKGFSQAYPPRNTPTRAEMEDENSAYNQNPASRSRGYTAPVAIDPPPNRPVFLAGLTPRPGAVGIPLDNSRDRLAGVEWRVGRGRVLMLALNPTDPALAVWPGLDTFIRRVILRRPEETVLVTSRYRRGAYIPPRVEPLRGTELSWIRYLSRDVDTTVVEPPDFEKEPEERPSMVELMDAASTVAVQPENEEPPDRAPGGHVAEWNDTRGLPRICREALEESSGIKIPNAMFVLKIVLGYILAIVPLNWLICRFVLGRRELAWIVVPLLSIGFAIGVERAAAFDMGYNSACDEIDVVEIHGDYPRAHVSRFSSLYSTGRTRFNITFPDDPTALALPLDNGRTLRGEDVSTTVWHSYPVPSLQGLLVQPRSLAMVRAEQMASLDGSISLTREGSVRRIVNAGSLDLRDAVLLEGSGSRQDRREIHLGTIPPGGTVEVKESSRVATDPGPVEGLRPQRFLRILRQARGDRPEDAGEVRLVAWSPRPLKGQTVEPAVDRHRGFTAVVVHLAYGPPPRPDGPDYYKPGNAVQTSPSRDETPMRRNAIAVPNRGLPRRPTGETLPR